MAFGEHLHRILSFGGCRKLTHSPLRSRKKRPVASFSLTPCNYHKSFFVFANSTLKRVKFMTAEMALIYAYTKHNRRIPKPQVAYPHRRLCHYALHSSPLAHSHTCVALVLSAPSQSLKFLKAERHIIE